MAEQALWLAVILQAMQDSKLERNKPEEQFHKRQAQMWLERGGKDFAQVCYWAGFNPEWVRWKVKERLEGGGELVLNWSGGRPYSGDKDCWEKGEPKRRGLPPGTWKLMKQRRKNNAKRRKTPIPG